MYIRGRMPSSASKVSGQPRCYPTGAQTLPVPTTSGSGNISISLVSSDRFVNRVCEDGPEDVAPVSVVLLDKAAGLYNMQQEHRALAGRLLDDCLSQVGLSLVLFSSPQVTHSSAMRISIVTLLLVLSNGVLSRGVHHSKPLATVTPCPEAPSRIAPPLITVTSQYQPVSTCEERTACFRRRCTTQYSYHTYEYVSTVIPCLAFSTTITRTAQSVLISRSSSTITNTHVETKVHHGHSTTTTATARTTVLKEWSAVYKDIGPLAIPGYKGSGLCHTCEGPNGEKRQEVEAIECTHRPRGPTVCEKYAEIWIYQPAPSTTTKAVAICSSRAVASSAGTFTFAFPQREPPATIHVPARTIILTIGGHHPGAVTTTTTVTATVTTVPGRVWTVFVTRSCLRPTTFTFDVTVTKTITYTVPPWVWPNPT